MAIRRPRRTRLVASAAENVQKVAKSLGADHTCPAEQVVVHAVRAGHRTGVRDGHLGARSEHPTLKATTGLPAIAALSAAARNFPGRRIASMYSAMTRVAGSSSQRGQRD